MSEDRSTPAVYQLHVCLRGISPAIWRRILLHSESTIADLHYTIQLSMGWTDSHLNRFLIRGREYGVAHIGGICFITDPSEVRLAHFRFRLKERFLYEYDFGDRWQHQVRVEQFLPVDPKRTYPTCVGGRRAAPPEGCGGPWAFMELEDRYNFVYVAERVQEILEDPDAAVDDYQEELAVLARWAAKDRFDRRAVNRRLKEFVSGGDEWAWESV